MRFSFNDLSSQFLIVKLHKNGFEVLASLRVFAFSLSLGLSLGHFPNLFALDEGAVLHASGDREVWDRGNSIIELFGHAVVNQSGEILNADYIKYNKETRILLAKGDCVYLSGNTILRGDEMEFNMDSRTGTVTSGRVSGENFTLAGERINKLGSDRYQTHWGEYSTCRDCPQTWTFTAEDVDLEVEGYAYMKNVVTKVYDAPTAWLPYLIVPIKSKRQTGFLFPTFAWIEGDGFRFVQPFFWAINRWSDMTIGLGRWANRGTRLEWEGRYLLHKGDATSTFRVLQDSLSDHESFKVDNLNPARVRHRWALEVAQNHELPFGISEKLRFAELSDLEVLTKVSDLTQYAGEPAIPSILLLSKSAPYLSGYTAFKRYRNTMPTDPDKSTRFRRFDPTTVQVYPSAALTTSDKLILGSPVSGGVTVGINNFTRSAGPFDYDYDPTTPAITRFSPASWVPRPGTDPLREATRVSIVPEVYSSFRLGDVFKFVPSLRYYTYFYDFHQAAPDLQRGYLLAQNEISTQFEKVFDWNGPEEDAQIKRNMYISKVKHLIRPKLTYSYIPHVREDENHPFMQQIRARPGYNFDNYDIVPLSATQINAGNTNYFYPLGHSIAYGLTTQLIRKEVTPTADPDVSTSSPRKVIELSGGQSFDIRENKYPTSLTAGPRPLSRAYGELVTSWEKLNTYTLAYWYPYISGTRYTLNQSLSYDFITTRRRKVYVFQRSVSLNYTYAQLGCENAFCAIPQTHNATTSINFSVNDYFLPSFSGSYNLYDRKWLSYAADFKFQSPAQCWQFILQTSWAPRRGMLYSFDLSINLSGQNFGGFTQAAETGMATGRGGI